MSYPNAYAHSTYGGHEMDEASIYGVHAGEAILGYPLTILQGIGGAPASAGTHLLGRAVDFSPWDAERKLRALKNVGFAIWHRPYVPRLWPEHLHGILILNSRKNERGLAPAGFRQIAAFDAHRDGLVSNRVDGSYHPDPRVVYHYPPTKEHTPVTQNNVTDARSSVVKAMHAADEASAFLDHVDPTRVVARSQIDDLQRIKGELKAVLEALPKV